jgi:hypothetical protein
LEKPLAESTQATWETLSELARLEVYSQSALEALQAALKKHHFYPAGDWAG